MNDFDEFAAGSIEPLLKTAYLITWDAGDAEDLVQECLFKLARRWPRVRRMTQPRAYARRVLVNLALDDARGRARRRSELAQTAEVLGCSPGTVKSNASRGLARLREALTPVPNPVPNPTREL
jgi:DNA-directed RNA polymerase specialized sigma24 family protein